MKNKTLSAAIITLASFSAHAVDGINLVTFPANNPDRVILKTEQGSYASLLEGTRGDMAGYNLVSGWARDDKGKKFSYDLNKISTRPKQATHEQLGNFQDVVTNVATASEPVLCNNPGCTAFSGQINTEQTCRTEEIKIIGEVNVGLTGNGMVGESEVEAGAGASVTAEWTKGWQFCKTKGNFHGCRAVHIPNSRSKTWPVTEARSRFADYKMTDAGGSITFAKLRYQWTPPFTDNWYERAYKPVCAGLGGKFSYPTKLRGVNSDPPSCTNIPQNKRMTWEKFDRLPYNGEGLATYQNCRSHTY
jgi:hypothetical protein